jgi:hypothetical protein
MELGALCQYAVAQDFLMLAVFQYLRTMLQPKVIVVTQHFTQVQQIWDLLGM